MAGYSSAQLEESLAEDEVVPQAAPKSWRRFGLVVAALGTAGAIVGMTRPKSLTSLQKMQQVAHVGHSFMQAVVARALQEGDGGISVHAGMIFAPVGLEEFPGVSAEVYLRPAEEEAAEAHVSVTFQAKVDEGEALKEQFQSILDGAKKKMADGPHAEMAPMLDSFEVANDIDKVHIIFTPPPPPPPTTEEADEMWGLRKAEQELEKGMAHKPTLRLAVHTQRDFQEMVDNIHTCAPTVPGGVNITAHTKLAKALIDAMSDVGDEVDAMMNGGRHHSGPPGAAKRDAMVMQAFSSFSSHSDIRYNTEKLAAAVCDAEESQRNKDNIEMMKGVLPHMLIPMIGEETVKSLAGLKDHASHLHSIRFAGIFPDNYEIYVEFVNFHLTPIISEFLQLPKET